MSGLVVAKVGSSTLMDERGELDHAFVRCLCTQICELRRAGQQVILVSSGAEAVGRSKPGFPDRPHDIPPPQTFAAAGKA